MINETKLSLMNIEVDEDLFVSNRLSLSPINLLLDAGIKPHYLYAGHKVIIYNQDKKLYVEGISKINAKNLVKVFNIPLPMANELVKACMSRIQTINSVNMNHQVKGNNNG